MQCCITLATGMHRNTVRRIIVIAGILLIGLVSTQIFWVQKAYQLQEQQLNYDITAALKKVAQQILLSNSDSTQLFDPVEQVSPNLFKVKIKETIQPFYLETVLSNEFKSQSLNLDFEYYLYDCFNDSVVFKKAVSFVDTALSDQISAPEIEWDNDAHYFGVYFPDKKIHLIKSLNFWIASSGLLIIIVVFFLYTIGIILKQKKLSEIKNDFINNMTHELKTPISTISLTSKVLLKPDIINHPERLYTYAEIIAKENDRLQLQVEKVLQIAALEKQQTAFNTEPVNIHQIIAQEIKIHQLLINEKQGIIETHLQAQQFQVLGDKVHLANIFSNLLDNAIKYNQNIPKVQVKTKNINKNLVITITDNGIGIDKKNHKYIFDKFYRVPKGDIHDVKGFGIGLHYVKQMVLNHKGTITIQSELHKGSTFTITLPYV